MSSTSGEIINFVTLNYAIWDMRYNKQADQIVIHNTNNLIFVDTYTFKSVFSIQIVGISSLNIIEGTRYIILTLNYNHLLIFDYVKQITVLNMDNSGSLQTFPDNYYLQQYYSNFYQLSTGENIILTTNQMGVIVWIFDQEQMIYTFKGYIQDSIVQNEGDGCRGFTKHPTQDIIFISGQSLEVMAVKIVDIQNQSYQTLFKINLAKTSQSDYISNILFDFVTQNGIQSPALIFSTNSDIYIALLDINQDYSQISIKSYTQTSAANHYSWYKQEQSSILFISSLDYITTFNYNTLQKRFYLKSMGDSYSSRFVRQDGQNINQLLFLDQSSITFSNKDDFTSIQTIQIPTNVRQQYGSFYQIKNSSDWYLAKIGEDSNPSQILTFSLSSIDKTNKVIDITDSFGLSWSNVNQNLDAFELNSKIYITFAFPHKDISKNYLFQMINCQQNNEIYYLTSNSSDVTNIQTAFAIASLENPDNLELIGVDIYGTVYSWDLGSQNIPFKFSIKFSECKNSQKGDVFHFLHLKRLILSCDDNKVYSFDFFNGVSQYLVQLSEQPLALKAFSEPSLVAIGDMNSGFSYIFKFNSTSQQFDEFLIFKPVGIKDKLIYINMLSDFTIWIQYVNINIFYTIQDCLSDKKLCVQCSQQYYFNVTNIQDTKDAFGIGTSSIPFTTSENFFTAITKAQLYQKLISGVADIGVNIMITSDNTFQLNPNFLNIDFNNIISLNLKSTQKGSFAVLQYQDILEFQNYNFIGFQDIKIEFNQQSNASSCGINFQNIKQGVLIDNLKLQNTNQTLSYINCQSIYAQSTQIIVQNYTIENEDFSRHQSVIASFNTPQITINNLSLINCTLGNSFSILNQDSPLQAFINNLIITQNKCPQIQTQDSSISVLFSAGFFSLNGLNMNNNIFCQKSIFSTIASGLESYQKFQFSNIEASNNLFQARSTYLFFDALYSMNFSPYHEINLQNIFFFNNKLFQQDDSDLKAAQYFELANIADIKAQNITIKNHLDIQFSLIQNSNLVIFDTFYCFSDNKYYLDITNQTNGCLQLKEIINTTINNIKIYKKQIQDTTLISLENNSIQQGSLLISDGEFTNLVLQQQNKNTQAIPIKIVTNYQIKISLLSCNFKNLFLQSIQISQTYSASALQVQNFQGSILIKDSFFENSYSNSKYGFINVYTNELQIDNVKFNNSTFTEDLQLPLFNSQGGMINVQAQNISVQNSNFTKATAYKGAFFYIIASSQVLQISFKNISFSEGYALIDGGAIFIDSQGQSLQFSCLFCRFKQLYTMSTSYSIIGLQNYLKANTIDIQLIDGLIQSVQGVQQNYFIKVASSSDIRFTNISNIDNKDIYTISRPFQIYKNNLNKEQSTLIQASNSQISIKNCSISNFAMIQNQATLLFQTSNSTLIISNTSVFNCQFISNAIYLLGGQMTIDQTYFINLTKIISKRYLIDQIEAKDKPSVNTFSLIYAQQTIVNIMNNSKFSQIHCQDCSGGALQIQNGMINIQNTTFDQIYSQFAGSIFIYRLQGQNQISNALFTNGQSYLDGGSIFLQLNINDILNLKINECLFQNNTSYNGRGGAIMAIVDNINPPNITINLSNIQFINNVAQIGGAIYSQNVSLKIYNPYYYGNQAKIYGQDSISYATKLQLVDQQQFLTNHNGTIINQSIEIMYFRSGGSLKNIHFEMFNDQDEKIFPATNEDVQNYIIQVRINPHTQNINNYQINGVSIAQFDKTSQRFTFSELNIVGSPNSSRLSNIIPLFKQCQKSNKTIVKPNSEIKSKIKRAFNRYLEMNEAEKKQFFIKTYEQILFSKQQNLFVIDKPQAPNTINITPQIELYDINSFNSKESNIDFILNNIKTSNFQTLAGLQQRKNGGANNYQYQEQMKNIQTENK
ncbi:hypothetical protein ABPG74_005384 [Tetrahymena malaccensis]